MREGIEKGQVCNRNGCIGIIDNHEKEGSCSCHMNPPCSYCTDDPAYCPECGWSGREEQMTHMASKPKENEWVYKRRTLADLDKTKLDWISSSHTHFSMIKEGVYPEGMTREQVYQEVKGTFGGRFNYFNEGKFKFIAYTD